MGKYQKLDKMEREYQHTEPRFESDCSSYENIVFVWLRTMNLHRAHCSLIRGKTLKINILAEKDTNAMNFQLSYSGIVIIR